MKKRILAIAGTQRYELIIGESLTKFPATFAKMVPNPTKVAIISDDAVALRYGHPLAITLSLAGHDAFVLGVPSGEKSKSLRQAEKLYSWCARKRMDRSSWIIALGGGVVGDLAGFIAATYLRGVRYIQVPTTLLAQVDSSIGGKTAMDIPQGKNLVGAFHQPQLVWSDPLLLKSLPNTHWRNGLAEVIKYGAILDAKLFALLEEKVEELLKGYSPAWTPIIARCAAIKARIVQQDPYETLGRRALLNFGHTLGHAIEAATGFTRYLHGEAISIGMFAAAIISQQQGLMDQVDRIRLGTLLTKAGLPIRARAPIPRKPLMDFLARDKKSAAGTVRFVLLDGIGKAKSGQIVSPEVLEVALTTVGL